MEIIKFSDIVESNGRTIRENNLTKIHAIPIGTLVEYEYTVRMAFGTELRGKVKGYVWSHGRDCDGTPLYGTAALSPRSVLEMVRYAASDSTPITDADVIEFTDDVQQKDAWFTRIKGMVNLQYSFGHAEEYLRVVPVVRAFTDYPIRELGDTQYGSAPIRECEVMSWDGDRYCWIRVDGLDVEVKRWYLYAKPERLNSMNPNWLMDDVLDPLRVTSP